MDFQERLLHFLYDTRTGRMLLQPLIRPSVSELAGKLLSTRLSTLLISGFVRRCRIDMNDYEVKEYTSYNDFFTRKIKPEKRPICQDPAALIAPCDAKLSVYPIRKDTSFRVKHTDYTLPELLKDPQLAKRYRGGYLFLFRLSVDDYHRYCYPDEGLKSGNTRIPGVFHTVNPIANDMYPIYKENTRTFSLLKSRNFGTLLMMEVGALLVGRIVNHEEKAYVSRGTEKGYFEFGGSTVILCVQKNQVTPLPELIHASENGLETQVKQGTPVAWK